jgi:phenylalanyl-tRNA synthetase beta chain
VDTAPAEPHPERVAFRPGRINRLLGTSFSGVEQAALLERVGIGLEPAAAGTEIAVAKGELPLRVAAAEPALVAIVPTWRRDLHIEADVAEEIARVGGYDTVPTKTPDTAMPHYRPDPLERREAVRRALAGAGLSEVVTPALVPAAQAARLGWPSGAADGVPGADAVAGRPIRVLNPLSERHAVLRSGLVASLLDVLALNERHGRGDVAVFEIGKGYAADPAGAPAEWWRLGFLLAGAAVPATWSLPGRDWDLEDAKALAALVARAVGEPEPAFEPYRAGAPLHPGRAARAVADRALAGLVGELHPETLAAWDLRAERVLVAELAVAGLDAGQLAPVRVTPVGRHPGVERDLAIVVAEGTPAGEVAATLRAAGGTVLREVTLFDVYRGAPLGDGEKSLAWRIALRGGDRPLEEAEVEGLVERLVAAVAAAHGARLRA